MLVGLLILTRDHARNDFTDVLRATLILQSFPEYIGKEVQNCVDGVLVAVMLALEHKSLVV
jgi:hypothetical protein